VRRLITALKRRWRERKEPVCPWCGKRGTFEPTMSVSNCGFDFRNDDY
jgi:hypothetical protein